MKEWLNRMLFSDESFGGKLFHIATVVFAFLFVFFWVWLILNFILNSILSGIKKLYERKKGYNPDLDYKIYLAEEKLERIFQFPFQIIPSIFKSFNSNSQINIKLIRAIVIGIAIPVVGVWIWYISSDKPFNEYLLITKSKTASGQIVKAEEYDDEVEINDGRSSKQVFYYGYEYNFRLPNGSTMTGNGRENGTLPDYLYNVSTNPYQVQVEYLANDPSISRVKDIPSVHKTIYEWLRYSVLLGVIVVIVCSYFGFITIRAGLKNYRISKKESVIQ